MYADWLSGRSWYDIDCLATGSAFDDKLYRAIDGGKQGVVLAHADMGARVELGATLAYNDVACDDLFSTKALDTKAFGM